MSMISLLSKWFNCNINNAERPIANNDMRKIRETKRFSIWITISDKQQPKKAITQLNIDVWITSRIRRIDIRCNAVLCYGFTRQTKHTLLMTHKFPCFAKNFKTIFFFSFRYSAGLVFHERFGHHSRCTSFVGASVVQSTASTSCAVNRVQYHCIPRLCNPLGSRSSCPSQIFRNWCRVRAALHICSPWKLLLTHSRSLSSMQSP